MEVHQAGGGINFTVEKTKAASEDELASLLLSRLQRMLQAGKQKLHYRQNKEHAGGNFAFFSAHRKEKRNYTVITDKSLQLS
jgi:imidazolonepropionase-like amidohydrolase